MTPENRIVTSDPFEPTIVGDWPATLPSFKQFLEEATTWGALTTHRVIFDIGARLKSLAPGSALEGIVQAIVSNPDFPHAEVQQAAASMLREVELERAQRRNR